MTATIDTSTPRAAVAARPRGRSRSTSSARSSASSSGRSLLFSGGKDSIVMLHLAVEGVLAGQGAVLGDARRHRPQLPRGHRVPRPAPGLARREPGRRQRAGLDRLRPHPRDPRASRATRCRPTTLLDAITANKLRRRPRRRPPRRGEGAGQGAHLQRPRRLRPVGSAQPAPRALGPLQRPAPPGRARAGLPDLELDRARHLVLHRPRGHRGAEHLLRPPASGLRAATAWCWRSRRGPSRATTSG